jgi:biopolymer transport protein ExbB/TolQ
MSTGAIIAIVVGALVLLAIVALVVRAGRNKRLEARRIEAGQLHEEAESHAAQAERRRAEFERESELAREHHDRARAIDPDVDDTGEAEAHAEDAEMSTPRGDSATANR